MFKKLISSFIIATALLFASLNVWAQPTAGFTASNIAVCADNPIIVFTNTSTNDVSWSWDFDLSDGIQVQSVLENPTWFFASSGTYTVTLTAYDGVNQTGNINQFTMTITIWALPNASFTSNTTEGCVPFEVCFSDQSIQGDTTITAWLWTFGDGGAANGSSPCYTYPILSIGTWPVSLQVVDANGCSDTAIISNLITVHAIPTANFSFATLAGNLVGCHPTDTIQFTDISIAADTTISSWEWDFGDGPGVSILQNPSYSYNASGNFNVRLIITDNNGCKDTIYQLVRIDDYQANFTATVTSGCDNITIAILDASNSLFCPNPIQTCPNSWQWNSPGGTPPSSLFQNYGVNYNTPGTYDVTLISSNTYGCTDTITIANFITVYPLPQVGFFADPLYTCDVPFDVIFTDTTPGAPPGCGTCSWVWDVDNWNPLLFPADYDWSQDYFTSTFTHTYVDSIFPVCPPPFTRIDYNVSLIVTDSNGCVDSLIKDIYISSTEPIAAFMADTSDFLGARAAEGCIPLRVHFKDISTYDTSVVPNDSIVNWYWDFGDGYTISGPDGPIPDSANDCLTSCTYRNPTHFYVDTGYFFVTLAITTASGCTDTIRMYENCECDPMTGKICVVLAGMPPVVEFAVDDSAGCFPFEANFFDLSSSFANQWYWDFGDGGTSTDQGPTYTYSSETGYFDVSLAASFYGCPSDTFVKDSMIYVDFPQALFNIAPISGDGAGILLSPSTFFCHEDTLATGGWEVSIRDTTVGANPTLLTLTITTDSFGSETTWDVKDSIGLVVLSGGPYIDSNLTFIKRLDLNSGCYTFTIYDASGNGICCSSGNGSYLLENDYGDTLAFGGSFGIFDTTTFCIKSPLDWSFLWVFNFGDSLASTFESVDTTIVIIHDTVFVVADTIIVPEDTIFFRAGDTTLFSVVCDSGYFIVIPADTLYLDADTIDTPNDTIRMIGDYMIWMGMSTDTIILMPDTTITTYTYAIISSLDTVIDSTFTIYMTSQATVITPDTIFGCDTNFTRAPDIIIDPPYTIVTTIGADTLYYIPHDSVGIATTTTFSQPDTVFHVSRDTILYLSADTVIIGNDTLVLAIDTIIINTATIFTPADTFFVGIDTMPADTTITPADTNWTDPGFSPIDTILLGGLGGCDTLFVVNDSIITPADTTINPEKFVAKLLKHTYTAIPDYPAFYLSPPGTSYEVKLYAYNSITNCLDSISNFVSISSVNAGFTINAPAGDTLGCRPFVVSIVDTTTTIYDIVMRHWKFGDGCTLTTYSPFLDIPVPPDSSCGGLTSGQTNAPFHFYNNAGTYTITLLVVDQFGCRDSITRQVVIKDLPIPFFVADTTTGCANDPLLGNLEVTFSDISDVFQPAQTVQWIWNYGDGTSDTTKIPVSPPHIYDTLGTFNAYLTITNEFGCVSGPQPITITTTSPTPNFIFTPNANCSGGQVSFYLVPPSGASPLIYYWDWCDSSAVDVTSTSPQTHTFINLDTTGTGQDTTTVFDVTLTIEDVNGCMQDTTLPITIQQPVADFYSLIADIDSVCPNIFSFFDSSSSDIISWSWDFGDGNTSAFQDPTNTYNFPGEYDVRLIVINSSGCIDTIIKPDYIIIKGPILIDTSMIANCSCAPCTVTFTAVGYNTDIFTWFFGDGGDTTVVVNANPGNPDTVTVTITYVYQQSGIFYPFLRLEDPLDSAGQRCPYNHFLPPVTIIGPTIDFFTNDTACGPRDVLFDTINTSGTFVITSWEWNFDVYGLGGVSPATSNQINPPPVVNYSNPGSYTVSLTAYFDTCAVTETKENYITVFVIPYTPIAFCPDSTITFSVDPDSIPLSIDSLVWSFEGDGSETGDTVEHTYTRHDSIAAIAYDVTLDLYNNGINVCTYVFPDRITVYPTPTAIFYIDPVVSGVQTSISFIDSSINATSWEWDFGDGSPVIGPGGSGVIINGFNPSGTYDNPFYNYDVPYGEDQSFTITLTVYNDFDCSDDTTADKTIELKIPNVFNPNSKEKGNSVFFFGDLFLDTLGISDATLKLIVFNRWGQKVYENNNYEECDPWNAADKCWDGTDLKGKPLNTDTYYYVLNFNDRSVVNGWVMIWRPE